MPIVLDGSLGVTTPMYNGTITANAVTPSVNMKNRIINGNMTIDQRNAGAVVTPTTTTNGFPVDRFQVGVSQNSKLTTQQSTLAPTGFNNSLLITSSSAYSIVSSDIFAIRSSFEGFNFADLGFGTASAKTVTLSFWVYSSLTGTFGGALANYAANRSYPFSYTISAANTWEQKSITMVGDTSGTWVGASSAGAASLWFGLGVGSTTSGTAGSWAGADYRSATGATSVVGTNGATFYITGVQLEVGSTATSFDYRPYGTELSLCQRYYEKSYNVGTVPATNTSAGLIVFAAGATSTNVLVRATAMFSVAKRANPTITLYDNVGNVGKISYIDASGSQTNNQTGGSGFIGEKSFQCESDYATSKNGILFHYTASIEL